MDTPTIFFENLPGLYRDISLANFRWFEKHNKIRTQETKRQWLAAIPPPFFHWFEGFPVWPGCRDAYLSGYMDQWQPSVGSS